MVNEMERVRMGLGNGHGVGHGFMAMGAVGAISKGLMEMNGVQS